MRKVDVHAHILPGVDDGSSGMEETLAILAAAYEQEFRTIIATPHYIQGSRHKNKEELQEILEKVKYAAKERFPDLLLYLGQEVHYFEGITEALDRGEALTMADSRYVLVEFSYTTPWNVIDRGIRKILNSGYRPIAAHVERYQALYEEGRLDELADMGCLIQMNYTSLKGNVLNSRTRWCRKQLQQGRVHLLGTDCHNMKSRKPDTEETMNWMKKKCSPEVIFDTTRRNAEKILGQKM